MIIECHKKYIDKAGFVRGPFREHYFQSTDVTLFLCVETSKVYSETGLLYNGIYKNRLWGRNDKYDLVEEWIEEMKETNPKDLVGVKKVSYSVIPETVIAEMALGLMEGARKYGAYNWRVAGVRASIYFDAARRHLAKWWEGQDIDPDSGVHEITKAIASLVVLRDAMIQSKCNDDRPPKAPKDWMHKNQSQVNELFEKYPESLKPYTEIENA